MTPAADNAAVPYDVVVVGGGTAGSVLASRVSADPDVRVLLIEAGAARPPTADPARWTTLSRGSANWGTDTTRQPEVGRAFPAARGRGLGGGSAINALAHLRGHSSSYLSWNEYGVTGWGFWDLVPHFKRSESAPNGDPAIRGTSGPLLVEPARFRADLARDWLSTAREIDAADDPGSGLETGFGWFDRNVVDGRRQSTADAYLRPVLTRPNLDVVVDALVTRLIFSRVRCTGIEFLPHAERPSTRQTVEADEVILAAGAIGSPHLLMRSGVGPGPHLRRMGVDVVADLPGVGSNLSDHPRCSLHYHSARSIDVVASETPNQAGGAIHSDASHTTGAPDLQLIISTIPLAPPGPGVPDVGEGYSLGFAAMTPHSRGTVRLASADPTAQPLVDPNYLRDPRDAEVMARGFALARELGEGAALTSWRGTAALLEPDDVGGQGPARYVARNLGSYSHFAGTCRLGSDPGSVVDAHLCVHGIAGLRVVDASIMPSLPSANINATVVAIAERAADLIVSGKKGCGVGAGK